MFGVSFIEVLLMGVFALGVLAFLGVVVRGVVRRTRGRDDGAWEDAPAEGDPPTVRPGPGWGNGGSWI